MAIRADVNKFKSQLRESLDLALRDTVLDVFSGIVKGTPVDQGTLRGNWSVGIGLSAEFTPNQEANAGDSENAALNKVSEMKWGESVIIANPLVYAWPIEEGHSKQAPNGMLRINMLDAGEKLIDAVKLYQPSN